MHFFTPVQQRRLQFHLSSELQTSRITDAVLALDLACWNAAAAIADPEWEKKWRHRRAIEHKHFSCAAEHANELREALGAIRALVNRPLLKTAAIDWHAFDRDLEILIVSLTEEAEIAAGVKTSGQGRPPQKWRDELIAVAYSIYPDDAAAKTANGHFEETVSMLLRFLGRPLEDVHSQVLDSLSRLPTPPFRVFTLEE